MGILPDEEYNAVLTVLRLARMRLRDKERKLGETIRLMPFEHGESQRKILNEEKKRLKLAEDLFVRFELIKKEDVK